MGDNNNKKFRVGFDLGGTKILCLVFDENFRIVGRKRRKTRANAGQEAGLARIVETIEIALKEAGVSRESVEEIGIGCPGPLDLKKGVIVEAPNLGWSNVQIKKVLEKAFGRPVVVANDVDAGVYAEYRFGAAKKAHCVLGVFPGTGIGAGCVYEGLLIQGSLNSCMEIGHIPMVPDGPLCGCGMMGCLEAVASRLAVSSAAAAAALRGQAPNLLAMTGTDVSNIRSGALAEAISAGDKAVERIVRQAARWLGRGVAVAVNLLAPDVVVLGGGLVEAMADIYTCEAEKEARANVLPSYRGIFKIAPAQMGDDATAMGAAAWAQAVITP